MSWMDSWSRPKKQSAVPPPFYLTIGEDARYCKTCGRIMNSKKSNPISANTVKYCSARCRGRKPGPNDKRIERAIVDLLDGKDASGLELTAAKAKCVKGDKRLIVTMDEIEAIVFGSRFDPEKIYGRKKNRAKRALDSEENSNTVDTEDSGLSEITGTTAVVTDTVRGGASIRLPQTLSDVNGSIGGEKSRAERQVESEEALDKRAVGDRRAEEREMVRRAARRGIVFGFVAQGHGMADIQDKASRVKECKYGQSDKDRSEDTLRKCEAVMLGQVVEPSFAKGDWGIRWRE
ncbi:hypothetical protein EJ05DRAFT_507076 [Pseudovirgaria hyperparasitica]|uniref:Uncharacterized protein n=1 Tax=Pseudovirgaria hyperparasitica TaxID=470096 RepID=A0A6A6WN69_9PEZI|nr:uncharacterized protein EJ05DRAFT_507076 [Pseudovirgaria hyperparasitica]KAF2763489.1 hypothetical protein EJ05DRAFT_507076 [Pseudovirgaria hyperparasitica]